MSSCHVTVLASDQLHLLAEHWLLALGWLFFQSELCCNGERDVSTYDMPCGQVHTR